MHIPDGFLDTRTAAAAAVIAAVGVGIAVARARRTVPPARVPVLGLSAAFLFAAQMVNFPVAGGTSGHLMGSLLAAILLGPSGAVIALTAVLIVQALLFADGGVLALGANVVNIALVGPLVGYALFRAVARLVPGPRGRLAAAGLAAWGSLVAAAAVCAGELAWSSVVPWNAGLPAMAGIHAVIGLGEAAITMVVIAALGRVRPDLTNPSAASPPSPSSFVAYALLVILILALFIAPFASPLPDGLEKVASRLGFSSRALPHSGSPSPLADYRFPGIEAPALSAGLAGGVGVAAVLGLSFGLAMLLIPRGRQSKETDRPAHAPPRG